MIENKVLSSFVQERYNAVLRPHPYWSEIPPGMSNNIESLLIWLILRYTEYVRKDPAFGELSDDILMAMVFYGAQHEGMEFKLSVNSVNIFGVWTQGGTRDISQQQALILQDPLRHLFNNVPRACYALFPCTSASAPILIG